MKRIFLSRYFSITVMILIDMAVLVFAFIFSYALRFDFFRSDIFEQKFQAQMFNWVWIFVAVKLFFFLVFRVYRTMWRFSTMNDMIKLFQVLVFAELVLVMVIAYFYRFAGFSRAIPFIDGVLSFTGCSGVRFVTRFLYVYQKKYDAYGFTEWFRKVLKPGGSAKKLLLIGPHDNVEKLLREIEEAPIDYNPIGILFDDKRIYGSAIRGIPVYGSIDDFDHVAKDTGAESVFISSASLGTGNVSRLVEKCEACGIECKVLPPLDSIIDGRVSIKSLRDVNYEDLLGRPPVQLDTGQLREYIGGATVLVTGAGGSIGSELCRQLVRFDPDRLVLLDSCEEHLFNIHVQLEDEYGFESVCPLLGRVQDGNRIEKLFSRHHPGVIFHAAACKHVPLMEANPSEALINNIIGSYRLMAAADRHGVERFVLVSTDKAVNPTNVMGASKRVAELILHAIQERSGSKFMAVRFGNVVGSSGSVIPIFRRQIAKGGPVTVTHPEATRYFMTISEASQLILQAGAVGSGGEIFILEMGTRVNIAEMARDLILLSGKEPDKDIEIKFTGLRPGEKLYEELITVGEGIVNTAHDKLMVLRSEDPGVFKRFREDLPGCIRRFEELAACEDEENIRSVLAQFIPEYRKIDS